MSDFITTIGDVADVYDGPHATPKKIEKGPYFLSISSLENGALDLSKSAHVSEDDFIKWTKRITPQEGDLLFSYETRLGDAALMPPNMIACLGRRMGLLRPDRKKVIPEYLLYAYLSPRFQETIRSKTIHGATVDRIALREMPNFEIRIPSKKEQLRVVSILKALDKKIELNRQTNQTLENIAHAIFKSWFVDFEPTRAKIAAKQVWAKKSQAEKNNEIPNAATPEQAEATYIECAAIAAISGKPQQEIDQLTSDQLQQLQATATLFPDTLVESELGEIPEGWEIKNIEQISTNVAMGPFGSNIKVDTFVDEGIPIINGQQLKGLMLEDCENRFITHEHADKLIKSNVYRDDIVITHRGTLGQVSIIPECSQYDRYIVSQSQCYIRPDKKVISPFFLIFYFKSFTGQHELLAHKSQVGVPSIAKPVTNIRKIELVVPAKNILDEFQAVTNSLQLKNSNGLDENYSLKVIRDTLLPKLLSGELQTESNQKELKQAI